jgi:hypothetical protein
MHKAARKRGVVLFLRVPSLVLGEAQTTDPPDLTRAYPTRAPAQDCGPDDPHSEDRTGFARIRNEDDCQTPCCRLLTLGFRF